MQQAQSLVTFVFLSSQSIPNHNGGISQELNFLYDGTTAAAGTDHEAATVAGFGLMPTNKQQQLSVVASISASSTYTLIRSQNVSHVPVCSYVQCILG